MKHLAVGIALVFVLVGCSTQLDVADLESQIEAWAEEYTEDPTVECGENRDVEAGASFLCELSGESGFITDVKVTMLDDKGSIEWEPAD